MNLVLGIDPGSTESAYCLVDHGFRITEAEKVPNPRLTAMLWTWRGLDVAVESIQSYGMVVGRSVFDTCFMIGRVQEICSTLRMPCTLYPRPEYTRRICGVGKVNDAVLRQALLLRFGGDKKGEPLFALKGCTDKRSAFAVAAYHIDITAHERGIHERTSCEAAAQGS